MPCNATIQRFPLDYRQETLAFYEPGVENISPGYQVAIVSALHKAFPAFGYDKYRRGGFDVQWLHGPDAITTVADDDQRESSGVFLSITPADNAIEIDHVAYLELGDDQVLMDGECAGKVLLGRMVGLFQLDNLAERLSGDEFLPDVYFADGERCEGNFPKRLARSMANLQRIRSSQQREHFRSLQRRYDLCPITRALLSRVVESLAAGEIAIPPMSGMNVAYPRLSK